MPQDILITMSFSLVAAFLGLLMAVLGWMGNKLYNKIDEISKNLVTMASELHTRITGIDIRLTRVETVSDLKEGTHQRRRATDKEQEHGNS